MQTPKHYHNAPIIEAIIDLRVSLREGFPLESIRQIAHDVEPDYVLGFPLRVGNIRLQAGSPADVNEEIIGSRFMGVDQVRVFQATTQGFTFNRLAPYTTWEEFFTEARRLWGIYRNACEPLSITRAAVRFVNRIDIPSPSVDLKEYLRTYPEISSGLPQNVTNYFMRLETLIAHPPCALVMTQATVPSNADIGAALILDFEVVGERTWDPEQDDAVWSFLNTLRDVKNRAFEESITDQTRRLMI